MRKEIIVLPGDGIGPEVTDEAVKVLETVCKLYYHELKTISLPIGGASIDRYAKPLTDETLEACKNTGTVLLGAVGGEQWNDQPKDKRPESALLGLRKELDLFANLRPIKTYQALLHSSALKREIVEGVDIMIVRELTSGIYFGKPRLIEKTKTGKRGVDTLAYETYEIERVARMAFEIAAERKKKVISVDKANVLDASRLWREVVGNLARNQSTITVENMLVDNAAMQLVRNPKQFDVILTSNMFGDILSDEASMITGSIGMLPSASLGEDYAMYEPVHGSAPDIAGEDKANPLAAIASAAMMCRHSLDMPEAADQIEQTIHEVLSEGIRTGDLYSGADHETKVGTVEMGSIIRDRLESSA